MKTVIKMPKIMSKEEALALPPNERPLCFRLPSRIYHDIFEAVGSASLCWNPRPTTEVFNTEEASNVAVELGFKIAEELERLGITYEQINPTPSPVTDNPREDAAIEKAEAFADQLAYVQFKQILIQELFGTNEAKTNQQILEAVRANTMIASDCQNWEQAFCDEMVRLGVVEQCPTHQKPCVAHVVFAVIEKIKSLQLKDEQACEKVAELREK